MEGDSRKGDLTRVSPLMAEESSSVRERVKYDYDGSFRTNSRGVKLFTCQWSPVNEEPKALVFLLHGYTVECSLTMKGNAITLAKAGYGVYGIDYEGHGKSAGMRGYFQSFEDIVSDCSEYFMIISEKEENKTKKRFLYGDCLGGAVALFLHRRMPNYWDGAVLIAPMCKISDEVKPSQFLINTFDKLAKVAPTWKIVPSRDQLHISIRDPKARERFNSNPYCYKGKLRLKTANEIFYASMDLEAKLDQIRMPFIVVHGGDDVVVDSSGSELIYKMASSTDKTFKLYPGMWHSLTTGEFPENINIVLSDIISWLDERTKKVECPRLRRSCDSQYDDDNQS